jgi:DNA-binding transcriptional MerR regulator
LGKELNMKVSLKLRELISTERLNIKEFSKVCGIPYNTLQNYLLERRTIGVDALTKISVHLNVNLNWLLTGVGPMYQQVNEHKKKIEKIKVIYEGEGAPALERLAENWNRLNNKQRGELAVRAREMLKNNAMEAFILKMAKQSGENLDFDWDDNEEVWQHAL